MFFQNADKEILHFGNIVDELYQFAQVNPTHKYDLVVGSDSQRRGLITTHATVVFLWNLVTRKFRLFYNKERIEHTGFLDLSTRIITEATRSIEVASDLMNSKVVDLIGRDCFEVHLDVGYRGKSKKIINTVTGMVKGCGFEYKIKPDAWVASCVADRLSK